MISCLFFKQKTAYEMRISDWSSDVCSSDLMTEVPAASGALVPEQLNTTTRSVGTVRLYAEDVRNLVNEISRDFTQNRVVITYPDQGGQKNIYSDQFEVSLQNLPEIRYLNLSIKEPELYGINRMAMIELSDWGENMITVQRVQEDRQSDG